MSRSNVTAAEVFQALESGLTRPQVCEKFGLTPLSLRLRIQKLRKTYPGAPCLVAAKRERLSERRPMPRDFAKIAPSLTITQAIARWRFGYGTAIRLAEEAGIVYAPREGIKRPTPDNWAELCAAHTIVELTVILKVDRKVIARIASETGIKPKAHVSTRTTRADTRFQNRPKQPKNIGQMGIPVKLAHQDNRIKTMFDYAADVIRAERYAVFRCREAGAYDENGEFWRVGNGVLTPDQLLQRADRYRARVAA